MKKYVYLISVLLLIFNSLLFDVSAQQRNINGKTLPFSENWHSGDFTTNNWQVNSDMISVTTSVGNESPSLRFHKPTYLNEVLNLTSDTIDATSNKIGHIFITFDLMHSTDFPPAIDYFIIQISNGLNWISIDSIPRPEEFVWFSYKYDLADFALNKKFKIRFQNAGDVSEYSWSWYLDNIEIYIECDPPIELEGEVYFSGDTLGSLISWKTPLFEGWKHWDSGNNWSGLGHDCGTCPTSPAAHWDAGMLDDIVGDTIKKIRYFASGEYNTDLYLKIWTGSNPPELILCDTVETTIPNSWNIHEYSNPIVINDTTEYWFGYLATLNITGNNFFLALDEGPAVEGYGNMIMWYEDPFYPLSEIGFNNNFNIQILANKKSQLNTSNLLGFNVYAMYSGESEYNKIRYVEFDESNFNYSILDTCYTGFCNAFYKVEAVWQYAGETCYSAYAKSKLFPEDDFVYVIYEGYDDLKENPVEIYPNPTTSELTVKSEKNINNINIFNSLGQLIMNINADNMTKINVENLKNGIYFLKIQTKYNTITKKFLKQ